MPKTVEKEDQTTARAISESNLNKLLTGCKPYENSLADARTNLGNLIKEYVQIKNAHAGVIALVRKLDRMDPVKRNEFLFHFDVCREHRGWERVEDLFDRGEDAAEAEAEEDLRPRYLRTGGVAPND
jgi:hypothetical protein